MSIAIAFGIRLLLVLLFLPFSAADKIVNFRGAVGQAGEIAPSRAIAKALILVGLTVEIVMSLGVLTGVADRMVALILAGYCMATAVLWKRFWAQGDFAFTGQSKGRDLLWDFLKNFALAGGFLLVTFGTSAGGVDRFFTDPLGSTHPYSLAETPS